MDLRIGKLCFFTLLLHLWPMVSGAQEIAVPAGLQVALFGKILTFDRSLQSRGDVTVVIGIVYQDRFKASLDLYHEFFDEMSKLPEERIAGFSYRLVGIDVEKAGMEQTIVSSGVDILYITPLRAVNVEEITSITRARRVLTLTGVPEYVQKGISVGIGTKAGKPQILINLKSSRMEHADFNSQLLKVARIVESEEVQ